MPSLFLWFINSSFSPFDCIGWFLLPAFLAHFCLTVCDISRRISFAIKTHLFVPKNSVTFASKVAELRLKNNRLMIWNLCMPFCLRSVLNQSLFLLFVNEKYIFLFHFFCALKWLRRVDDLICWICVISLYNELVFFVRLFLGIIILCFEFYLDKFLYFCILK